VPKLYPEALLFCVLWTALAVAGFALVDWQAGVALSLGLFAIIMPSSALILSRTSNFALEKAVRWAVLAVAALILFSVADLGR
jgi:hypothetical protein